MSLSLARRALIRDINFRTHGVPATVTPPYEASVDTSGIWVSSLFEDPPVGRDVSRMEPRRVMALDTSELPDIPRGTKILAAEEDGGSQKTWNVDAIERTVPGIVWVVLVPEHI